ncbi:MAG: hypothetical protein PHO92_03075 [Candidatus Peribacteraceae bacterium]|nr:hypothetical protein [Candidatus Peribacteraceae bacterium]
MAFTECIDPLSPVPETADAAAASAEAVETQQSDTRIRMMIAVTTADEVQLRRWLSRLRHQPDHARILQIPQKLAARIGLPSNWLQCTEEEEGIMLRNCFKPVALLPHNGHGSP